MLAAAACLIAACADSGAVDPQPTSSPVVATERPLPTQTAPQPVPTAAPEHKTGLGDPSFEDGFEAGTGWEIGTFPQGAVSLLDGKLVVSVQGPSVTLVSLAPIEPISDFLAEIEIRTEICESGDEFGLMLRAGGPGNPLQDSHYRFLITCEGAVRASRFIAGREAPMLPITPNEVVLPGAPSVNRLAVSAVGDQFRIFVNDIEVYLLMDGEIPAGKIGALVRARQSPQTTIAFDSFRVWDLSDN